MNRVIAHIVMVLALLVTAAACTPSSSTNAAFRNYEYAPDAAFNNYPSYYGGNYGYANNQQRGLFNMNNQH